MNLALPLHAPAWPRPAALPGPLRLAIGVSIGIHALALLVQGKGLPSVPEAPPAPLEVVLRMAAPLPVPLQPASLPPPSANPVPATLPQVETPPRPARPEPRSTPVMTRPAAQAPDTTPTLRVEPAPVAPVAPVAADAAPPQAQATPSRQVHVESAPATAATAPPVADEALDPALLERYGRSLSALLARQQNYPRLAALRGWEGEVQVRVTIARKGNVVATQVVRSSGFEVLDQSAIQLVSGAGPLPRPPEALQNRELQIIVPVLFKLDKPA